jgi:hypothetical protein
MTRVKMNARHEYEFIANFKVMQNVFKAKRIDKVRSLSLPFSFPVPPENEKNTPLLTPSTLQLYSLSPWKS